jgi:D-glycero-D-manno-heptose 1,7-bisphosphate phosphatase
LNAAGVLAIVVSNQSGIGRGYFTHDDFQRVQRRVEELLALENARLDAIYICPHSPERDDVCQCRKPGTLLFRTAIGEHGIDPERSWYIGDRWRDLAAADVLGGRGILVPTADTPDAEIRLAEVRHRIVPSLAAAVEHALGSY